MLLALWRYRGFIFGSVKRDFRAKYLGSLLGASWSLMGPLVMVLIYTLVFSEIMAPKLPSFGSRYAYGVYLCAGMLAWSVFAEIAGRAQTVFLDNANLLKKLSFPRLCLPIIVVLNASINFLILLGVFLVFLLSVGQWPGWSLVAIVPLLALEALFAIGLGVTLGVLNVFFRDVGQVFGIALQIWFWLTPIVYTTQALPEFARDIIQFNPMVPLVAGFQAVLLNGQWPEWEQLGMISLIAPLLCALGLFVFRRHSGEMVDEL